MKSSLFAKKNLGCFITTFLLLTLSSGPILNVSGQVELMIENDRAFIDSNGFYHVYGEVVNKGVKNYSDVKLEFLFYDEFGQVLFKTQESSSLSMLLSGRRSPFSCLLTDHTLIKNIKSYSITISDFSILQEKPLKNLQIAYHSPNPNSSAEAILGVIKNNGKERAKFITLFATYHFSNKTVLTTSSFLISGLDPGASQSFTLDFPYNFNLSYVKYYSLTAECLEPKYAIEKEIAFAFFTPGNPFTDPVILTFIVVVLFSATMLILAFLITKVVKKRRRHPRKSVKPKDNKSQLARK